MTPPASSRRRAPGGCSGSSAMTMSRCSMADCRNGRRKAGRSTNGPPRKPQERHFTARYQAMMVRDKGDVLHAVEQRRRRDRRCPLAGRVSRRGTRTAPRRARRPHAGCANVHYATLLKPDGTLKSPEEISKVFRRCRRRYRQAGHHRLRFGRDRRDPHPRA